MLVVTGVAWFWWSRFAGDIVRGASLVVWAIRDGREAADSIAGYLTGAARVAAE